MKKILLNSNPIRIHTYDIKEVTYLVANGVKLIKIKNLNFFPYKYRYEFVLEGDDAASLLVKFQKDKELQKLIEVEMKLMELINNCDYFGIKLE